MKNNGMMGQAAPPPTEYPEVNGLFRNPEVDALEQARMAMSQQGRSEEHSAYILYMQRQAQERQEQQIIDAIANRVIENVQDNINMQARLSVACGTLIRKAFIDKGLPCYAAAHNRINIVVIHRREVTMDEIQLNLEGIDGAGGMSITEQVSEGALFSCEETAVTLTDQLIPHLLMTNECYNIDGPADPMGATCQVGSTVAP